MPETSITTQQFLMLAQVHRSAIVPRMALAALIGVAVGVTVARLHPALGMLILSMCLLGCGVLWYRYFRRSGWRFNNYNPLKSDAEMQRTRSSIKEHWHITLMVLVPFFLLNLGRVLPRGAGGIFAGVLACAFFHWALGIRARKPVDYTLPDQLLDSITVGTTAQMEPAHSSTAQDASTSGVLATGSDALIAALYALQILPGGYQVHKNIAVKLLVRLLDWDQKSIEHHLATLRHRGQVVGIRELRTGNDACEWLTLTAESSQDFQRRIKAGTHA